MLARLGTSLRPPTHSRRQAVMIRCNFGVEESSHMRPAKDREAPTSSLLPF
jgi:hypothetical protein